MDFLLGLIFLCFLAYCGYLVVAGVADYVKRRARGYPPRPSQPGNTSQTRTGSGGASGTTQQQTTYPSSGPQPPPGQTGQTPPGQTGSTTPGSSGYAGSRPTESRSSSPGGSPGGWRPQDLTGLVDALTGAPLEPMAELYQCQRCHAFYEAASYRALKERGRGCVSCQSPNIRPLPRQPGSSAGQSARPGSSAGTRSRAEPGSSARPRSSAGQASITFRPVGVGAGESEVLTLANYRPHINRNIVFEGRVVRLLRKKSAPEWALMFENQGWNEGLKLVVPPEHLVAWGGEENLRSLVGRRIRVRGLLEKHYREGYRIIPNGPPVILRVE